jgi:GNAT superfamily N-acetyltransferase
MPSDELRVRSGGESDVPATLELMSASLGTGRIPRTHEFFRWKHFENPFGRSAFLLAFHGHELVGVRLFMRWRWHHGSGAIDAVRAVDTATHPAWQGKGIFKRLTLGLVEELTREGVGFVFNTPNEQSRPGYLKMGWVAVGRCSLWILPRRPLQIAASFARRAAGQLEPAPAAVPVAEGLSDSFRQAGESCLLGYARTPGRYHTPHDPEYLAWRYARCPAAMYATLGSDGGRALAVYRMTTRRGLRELRICDLFVEPSRRGMREGADVLRAAVAENRPDYASAALHPELPEAAALARAGFLPAPRSGPILTVRALDGWGSAPDPRSRASWRATLGDLELF